MDLMNEDVHVKLGRQHLSLVAGVISIGKKGGSAWACPVEDLVDVRLRPANKMKGYLSLAGPGESVVKSVHEAMKSPSAVVFDSGRQQRELAEVAIALEELVAEAGTAPPNPLANLGVPKPKEAAQLEGLEAQLDRGEVVDSVVFGFYEGRMLGSDVTRKGLLAATNLRLVFYGHKLMGYDLESFNYDKISSFEETVSMGSRTYSFFASNTHVKLKIVTATYGGDFTRTVRSHLSAAPAPAPAASKPAETPAADGRTLIVQLRELGALRDEGVLTEEEFAAQKAKLLGT